MKTIRELASRAVIILTILMMPNDDFFGYLYGKTERS